MTVPGDSSDDLPLEDVRRIDELCDEIERRVRSGDHLDLASFLNRVDKLFRERLIGEALALFLEHAPPGDENPVEDLIRQNPELREEIQRAAKNSSGSQETAHFERSPSDVAPALPTPRRRKSRGIRIRCPHCSNHVELIGDASFDSVSCTVCGSTFSLVDRSTETRMAETLQKIDRFELVSRLGVGGFGTVWKARDTELERSVAVKIPRYGQLSPSEMEQFFREARSVAQLRHPNIVPVHEVGREGDAVFIVSDLIRGVSLADMLTAKRPSQRKAAELGIVIAEALDHAHRRGVIHRDLKPSNVMIDEEGTPFLMDFGLAKRETDEVTMTMDGQIVGTPAYMSPEQAGGKSAWADRRTDVYSFGVILFEMLTGELPFRGNAQMQVHQRVTDDAPNARTLNSQIPKDIATICAKCLEREPGARYQSAKDVAEELRRFLDREPIKARPLSAPQRLVRWVARKPLQAAVAALVVFLAVAGPIAAVTFEVQRRRIQQQADENARLIVDKDRDVRQLTAEKGDLRRELDVWEGRINASAYWPLERPNSPRRRLLRTLYIDRYESYDSQAKSGALGPWESAILRLALATMAAESSRPADATDHLQQAEGLLRRLVQENPAELGYQLALARCCSELAEQTASASPERAAALRQDAVKIYELLAAADGGDKLLRGADLFDQQMAGALQDADTRARWLANAEQTHDRLAGGWPTDPAELHALVSYLTGKWPLPAPASK